MDLELRRVDYTQVGVTSSSCLKILPELEKRRTSKIVIGDKNGVINCIAYKKKDVSPIFKTIAGSSVTSLTLGGSLGTLQDKIFLACGSLVLGYSKKGKKFLSFDTNLTGDITCLCVSGNDLLVTSDFIYNHFADCLDSGYFLSSDKINDVLSWPPHRKEGEDFTPILACNDRIIRVLKGSNLKYEIEVAGIPQCMAWFQLTGGEEENELVYGTQDGLIGCVKVGFEEPTHLWEIDNDENMGGVTCISHYDITGDGTKDVLIGRDDGTVQIFNFNIGEEPFLVFKTCLDESITSICGAKFGSASSDEILVSTYSGWIIGLTTEQQTKTLSSTKSKEAIEPIVDSDEAKIAALTKEIDELRRRVDEQSTIMETKKATTASKNMSKSAAGFHVNDKFTLSPSDASYTLCIEVQTAIDHIVLQSDVPVDLLDAEKNSAVVSYSSHDNSDPNSGNFLLATYRCQASTTRLEVKVRSIEGQYGYLRVYVTTQVEPKTCVMKEYLIKPLSLHQRTHFFESNRSVNVLKLTGPFSMAEMHAWVTYSLPDVPERTPTDDNVSYSFVNTFLNTQLECTYRKGEGIFKSDNISTISILKDVLTKEATNKKITLNIWYDINPESIPNTLSLIHPKLEYQLMLAKKVQLIDGLKELQIHEDGVDFLAPEYEMILNEADQLKEEFKKQPAHLERLYGMVTDLFIDKFKFKGVNVKQKVPQLLETLNNYELPLLIEFFEQENIAA